MIVCSPYACSLHMLCKRCPFMNECEVHEVDYFGLRPLTGAAHVQCHKYQLPVIVQWWKQAMVTLSYLPLSPLISRSTLDVKPKPPST